MRGTNQGTQGRLLAVGRLALTFGFLLSAASSLVGRLAAGGQRVGFIQGGLDGLVVVAMAVAVYGLVAGSGHPRRA